ncbi:MAG: ComEC/Rec2 family competence protein [Synergistaceae bacterium]|nr:ComEC/Rec2 family competence protein [Synergistaceae bacterium]
MAADELLRARPAVSGHRECFGGPLSEAPAFFILFCICLSLYLDTFIHSYPVAAAASLSLTAALILFITERLVKGWLPVFILVIAVSGLFSLYSLYIINKKIILPDSIETSGRVLSSRRWGRGRALLIATPCGKFAGYVPDKGAPAEGCGVILRGALFDFRGAAKPGGFDEGLYWRARGAVKRIIFFEIGETGAPYGPAAWRAKLERLIDERLLPLSASYMVSFTVGRREPPTEALHRRAGTSHLLAVSGLHIWIITGFFMFLIRGNLSRFLVISFLLWGYLLLSGMPAGGVRAALMAELFLAAMVLGRPSSAFNNVSTAAALLLLANPWYFFDLGCRLSVLCALFIAASAPFMRGGIFRAVCLTVLLWFVTAPLVTRAFVGEAPLAGLELNAAAIPAFGVIFPLVLILSLPPLFGMPFSWIAAGCSETILLFFQRGLEWGSSVITGAVGWDAPLFALSVSLFAAAAAMRCGAELKRASIIAAIFVLFLYCPSML